MTHIRNIDLNLLLLLDRLLEEPNVTKAAAALHLSQSATSRALGRLRDQLDDELFVPQGRTLVPTPFARQLRAPLRQLLGDLDRLILARDDFDPATTTQRFTIGTVDNTALVLAPLLRERFACEAPNAELSIRSCSERFGDELGDGELDVVLAPRGSHAPWISSCSLLESTWSVARRPSPDEPLRLSMKRYLEAGHVLVSPGGRGPGRVDEALATEQRERRVLVRVPDFLSAAFLVARSELLLTIPTDLAEQLGKVVPLLIRPCPLRLAPAQLTLFWHRGRERERSLAWLREQLLTLTEAHQRRSKRAPTIRKARPARR